MSEQEETRPLRLRQAQQLFAARAWLDAHDAFTEVGASAALELDDLWRMSWSASLSGREPAGFAVLERIYQSCVDAQPLVALRAALWLGFRLVHTSRSAKRTCGRSSPSTSSITTESGTTRGLVTS